MIAVVVDTNIVSQSPKLSRNEWLSLADNKGTWEVTLVMPETVKMEATRVIPRSWENEQKILRKARIGTFGLQEDLDAMVQRIQDHIDGYEAQLTESMSELGVELAPTPDVPHSEIAFRASRGIAPYQEGDKDGYRDTLIWLTVLDVATAKPDHEIWFVSDNTTDFGDPAVKRGKDDKEDASQLPRKLHPQLKEELERKGLQDRVKYATSLEALEQHIASMHGPIGTADLQELIDAVKLQVLGRLLNDQVSIVVAAKDAALHPRFAHGVVNQLLPKDETWVFSDAAYRGGDRWTANYFVDVDSELLAFTSDQNQIPSVVEKPLRVSGTVAFTKEGEPLSIQVSRIEALPGDPDRHVWNAIVHPNFWLGDPAAFQSLRDAAGIAAGWKLTGEQAETFRRAANMAAWRPSEEQAETFRRVANLGKLSEEQAETFRRIANLGWNPSDEITQTIRNAADRIKKSLDESAPSEKGSTSDENDPDAKDHK